MNKKQKIGLCISGGGFKGIVAIAIVEALLNKGIHFSAVSGSSIGSVIATYLALKGEVTSLKEEILNKNSFQWLKMIDPSISKRNALLKGKRLYKEYESMFGNKTFSDLKIPLFVTTTDLQKGKVKYFQKGKLIDPVAASTAIPGIFPPHIIDNIPYVDGGIMDHLPYEILFENGMDKVIAINLKSGVTETQDDFSSMRRVISRSISLLICNACLVDIEKAENVFFYSPKIDDGFMAKLSEVKKFQERFDLGISEFREKEGSLQSWLNE